MGRAAVRYAKAVLSVSQEKNVAEEVHNDMKDIVATLDNSAELGIVLNSPLIKDEVKLASLKEIFINTNENIQKLFEVLIQNKRVDSLGEVAKQYNLLFDTMHNIQVAKVTTAVALDDALSEKIKGKVKELTGNDATLINVVDEDIIGGFILRIGDLQYNASIAHKLTDLKRELSN